MTTLVPIENLTDDQWRDAHDAFYSLKLARHMGTDAAQMPPKPDLLTFYSKVMDGVERGVFRAWAILRDGKYVGHTILDKGSGEWEMGTALVDEGLWSSGIGVKAALHAMRWAFEEDNADWVIAFTNGKDPRVKEIVEKGGFRRFAHFWIMPKETWDAKWRPRMERFAWPQPQSPQ